MLLRSSGRVVASVCFTQTHCGICGLKGMPRRSHLTQESNHGGAPPVYVCSDVPLSMRFVAMVASVARPHVCFFTFRL